MGRYVVIRAAWDEDAHVWFVESSDIRGLVTEAESLEGLRAKLPAIVQDLLAEDGDRPDEIEIDLIARAHDRIRLAA